MSGIPFLAALFAEKIRSEEGSAVPTNLPKQQVATLLAPGSRDFPQSSLSPKSSPSGIGGPFWRGGR
jgi:hypothetical protein